MSRVGRRAAGAILLFALALGCVEAPNTDAPIRISAPGFDPGRGEPLGAHWDQDGASTAITLAPEATAGPWTTVAIGASDAHSAGRLLFGPPAALLAYHAASAMPPFAESLLQTRLALIDPERAGTPLHVALWLRPDLPSPGGFTGARLEDLALEEAARLLATAMALGAWEPLALDQFARDADARPTIPPFAPRAPGRWDDLRGTSLEGYLVAAQAEYLIETPPLRADTYLFLDRLLPHLEPLARRIEALAATLPGLVTPEALDAVTGLLSEHAHALTSYLDSVWVEQVVTRTGPDRIRMAIHVHSVVPVKIESFGMALDPKQALARGNAIGMLRLVDHETGAKIVSRIGGAGLVFPVDRALDPVALGPYRFGSTLLDYRIDGLEHWPELRERMLEKLDVRVVSHDGTRVEDTHLRRVWGIVDRRFSASREESPAQFAKSLPERLQALDGARPPRLANGMLGVHAGRHHLRDDLILPPGIGLRLEAGAEIAVDPGRSILVRGPLRIEGSALGPVRIGRADQSAAWGVLAAQGKGVSRPGGDQSRPRAVVRHLELDGGSEDQLRGVWYTGQLSIYHQDLELSDSTLSRSASQDNLNVARGSAELTDCRFLDSADDAVDFDFVSGSIRRTSISGMGPDGDGVDLAGSTLTLEDVVISDAGDKCISAGERSQVDARGVLLRRCDTAIASKDASRVSIRESLLLDNASNLNAYQKSQVFGPAEVRVEDVILAGATRPSRIAPESTLSIRGAVVVEPGPASPNGTSLLRSPADGALARALGEDGLREAAAFSSARYEALRALVPEDARPH